MKANRFVRWNKESLDFFKSASDNSINLRVMACHACASQTGEAFEEFVNSINSEDIRRKIKKVIILDSSYLYRHCFPGFGQYADPNIRTMWLLNNLYSIEKLETDVVMESWVEQINSKEFKRAYKQIMKDFAGDENGSGIIPKFREIIISHSGKASSHGKGSLEGCVNFALEECAHALIYLKNETIGYPLDFGDPITFVNNRYKLNIRHLRYKISNHAETYKYSIPDPDKINQKVISFLTEADSKVNFFVSDKTGNFIYKNLAFAKIAGNIRAPELDPNAWEISKDVMRKKKQIIIEEGNLGVRYLSVKFPLIVDDEVEGVIGVAIDLTDRKKAEELESQNKIQQTKIEEQEKFKVISEQVAHDIRSPLVVLSMLSKSCKNLSEKEHIALRNSITIIESIANNLLNGYSMKNEKSDGLTEDAYVLFPFCISEVLNDKKYQYRDSKNIKFDYSYTMTSNFVFIKGDYSSFCRMISNLINNAVEAFKNKSGLVTIKFIEKDQENKIVIKDNGTGMPKEMAKKLMENKRIASTKEGGHGIGMGQIRDTILKMKGHMSIASTEGIGTEITLTFPKCGYPEWFTDKILLHRCDTVVVLDDDPSIHSVWENRLEQYLSDITVKYFTQGSEAIDFINSSKEKGRIFLLTDYELRNQDVNGVDVVEKTNMQQRSIVVTSVYIYQIKDFLEKFKITKLLPKAYIDRISIAIEEQSRNVNLVIIDDDASFVEALSTFMKGELLMDTYTSSTDFLNNLDKYSKDTKIITDHDLKDSMDGFALAEKLHKSGYTKLYMMSGRRFEQQNVPPYLRIVPKDADFLDKLLQDV